MTLKEGKPGWFGPHEVRAMRERLGPNMDRGLEAVFEETAERFEALDLSPDYMVFGHGDLHGGNVAIVEDGEEPRLAGVFDLENTGILDVHYDFCRLNLIDDDLQERVMAQYQASPRRACPLSVERVETYSRAFLLYLIARRPDEDGRIPADRLVSYYRLVHLLREHVERYDATHGPLPLGSKGQGLQRA